MKKEWIAYAIQIILVISLLYAGFSQIHNYDVFRTDVNTQPIAGWLKHYIHILLPSVEIFTAIFLIFHTTVRTGLLMAIIYLSALTAYNIAVITGLFAHIPCSCTGIFKFDSWAKQLLFTGLLLLLSIVGFVVQKHIENIAPTEQENNIAAG